MQLKVHEEREKLENASSEPLLKELYLLKEKNKRIFKVEINSLLIMKSPINLFFIIIFLALFSIRSTYAQNTVGIGTKAPNPHAVLDLVSPENNQGLLVPRLTTAQRTAAGFVSILSSADNGLLIFDSSLGKFFYWHNKEWIELDKGGSTGPSQKGDKGDKGDKGEKGDKGDSGPAGTSGAGYVGGNGIEIEGNTIKNTSPDKTVTLTGSGATSVSGKYPDFTISSTDNNTIYTGGSGIQIVNNQISAAADNLTIGVNASESLEVKNSSIGAGKLQDNSVITSKIANNAVTDSKIASVAPGKLTQSTAITGQVLKWDGTSWAPANDASGDADSDISNEIQDLQLSGNALTLSRRSTVIDLSPFLDNTDNQTIAFNASTGQLTISNQASPVQLSTGGDITGSINNTTVSQIQKRPVSNATPTTGQVLKWNGTQWEPAQETGPQTTNGNHSNGGLNWGTTAPPNPSNGMVWLQTDASKNSKKNILKQYDSATNSWIDIVEFKGD